MHAPLEKKPQSTRPEPAPHTPEVESSAPTVLPLFLQKPGMASDRKPEPGPHTPGAESGAPAGLPVFLQGPGMASDRGVGLDSGVRSDLTRAFGDLPDIRVHTGPAAAAAAGSLGTAAFSFGRDVFFGAGTYSPDTEAGREIIAHEAAHVVQQRDAMPSVSPAASPDPAAERDARIAAGAGLPPLHRAAVMRVMTYTPTNNPDELVAEFTAEHDEWFDRNGEKLGPYLYGLAAQGPDHYKFVIDVVRKLETGYERKNTVRFFRESAGTAGMDRLASTPEGSWLINSLGEVYDFALFSSQEDFDNRMALEESHGRARGLKHAEAELDLAAKRSQTAEQEAPEPVKQAQIGERLRLIRSVLAYVQSRYGGDDEIGAAIAALQRDLDKIPTHPGEAIAFDISGTQAGLAQLIVERARDQIKVFAELLGPPASTFASEFAAAVAEALMGKVQRLEKIDAQLATRVDPMGIHMVALAGRVRASWIAALRGALGPDAGQLLATAESLSAALPRALDRLYLGNVEEHPDYVRKLQSHISSMKQWANWVEAKYDETDAERDALVGARRNGAPEAELAPRAAKIETNVEIVRLSKEGIGLMQTAVSSYEQMLGHTGYVALYLMPFGSVEVILDRCESMKASAIAGDLAGLTAQATRNREDEDVQKFLDAIPLFIAGGNMLPGVIVDLAMSVGILKVSSIASSLAGRLVSAGEGASYLNVAAQIAVESLVFTKVNRSLSAAVGDSPELSFWWDLILNAGLFTALRVSGRVIHVALTERGFEFSGWAAGKAAEFLNLQAYGVIRSWIERNQWPSMQQFDGMAADTIVMMAAMSKPPAKAKTAPGVGRDNAAFATLESFHTRNAAKIEGIESARARLAARIAEQLVPGRPIDTAARAELETEARRLENEMKSLVNQTDAVTVEGLRADLKALAPQSPEISGGLLAGSLGIPPEAGLQSAGGETQFSFEHGKTGVLERGLDNSGVPHSEETSSDGTHSVTAEPADGRPMFFVERAAAAAPEPAPEPAAKRRRVVGVTSAAKAPPPPSTPAGPPTAEVLDYDNFLTEEGRKWVSEQAKKELTLDQARQLAIQDSALHQRLVEEHFRRSIRRGETPGQLLTGKSIESYARRLPRRATAHPPTSGESVVEFLNRRENAELRYEFLDRLLELRYRLRMSPDRLPASEILANPETAVLTLQAEAARLPEGSPVRSAADMFADFVSGRGGKRATIGSKAPDFMIWDPAAFSILVVDPTHTVSDRRSIFHEFKSVFYARVMELMTGAAPRAIDFRSLKEQRELNVPR